MTPGPIAPPAMLVPDPRGVMGTPRDRAQRTIATTSPASKGTATARGIMRPIPAASE